jgi:hypothetical protein
MSVDCEKLEAFERGLSPPAIISADDAPNSLSVPRQHSSSSRLSAQAAPWYPSFTAVASSTGAHRGSSASSQPRREDEFPGTPVESSPAGIGLYGYGAGGRRRSGDQHVSSSSNVDLVAGVSPVPAGRGGRGGRSPSSSSSAAGSPILVARTQAYSTDADDNVILVPFRGYETEEEIIAGLAGDGYWWIPNSEDIVTAQQCHERFQQQQQQQDADLRAKQQRLKKKKLRKTRQDTADPLVASSAGGTNNEEDDDDAEEDSSDEADVAPAGGDDEADDDAWEDDPDAYADEWDSLDEDEQAWIEEQMRPQDNPEGFFF